MSTSTGMLDLLLDIQGLTSTCYEAFGSQGRRKATVHQVGVHSEARENPALRACTSGLCFSEIRGGEGGSRRCGPQTLVSPSSLPPSVLTPPLPPSSLSAHGCRVGVAAFKPGRQEGAAPAWPLQGSTWCPCSFYVGFFGLYLTGQAVSHGHFWTQGRLRGKHLVLHRSVVEEIKGKDNGTGCQIG